MATQQEKQPNFLFVIADQLRFDNLGCYGNRIVKTPNIDALAAKSFVSDAFYVATPICMPNRATLLTGRMPSVHGVRHNGSHPPRRPVDGADHAPHHGFLARAA